MPDPKDPKPGDPKPGDPKPDLKPGEKPGDPGEPLAFDTWIGEQEKEVVTMLEGHTTGLKTALDSERENSKGFEKQLRELADKAEGDQKKALEGMADKIDTATMKSDFYEAAHAAGVTNLKLAYHAAITDEMFDRKGNVNFDTMKTGYPELFGGKPKSPKGGAGDGHSNNNQPAMDLNAMIRKRAGR